MQRTIMAVLMLACVMGMRAQGVLTWLETTHDFGAFSESEGKVTCTFRAVNTGNEPVSILRVQPTCGCTTGEYTTGAIAPGDTATVTLTYHATGRVGSFRKTTNVYTNTAQRRITLYIKGSVQASNETVEELYPHHAGALSYDRRTIMFGEVVKGASKMGYIGAYNNSADTLRVTFENVPEYVELEAFPPVVPPFALCTLSGYFESAKCPQWGLTTAEIGIAVAEGDSVSRNTFSVAATVKEDFSKLSAAELANAPIARVSDEVLDFGTIESHEGVVRRQLTVSNAGSGKLIVRRVWCADGAVGVSADAAEVKPGKACTVDVAVNMAKVSGSYFSSRLTVITNDPSHPVQEVRLVGMVRH